MGMPQSTVWTVAMANALPDDGNRYEVIDGELLVTPAPTFVHQRAVGELTLLLAPYSKALRVELFASPIDVTFSEGRNVQPDLAVLPRLKDGTRATTFADVGVLLLAVEVLSPSSLRTDRHIKRRVYQQEHVHEYWIVDPFSRSIERWTPESELPDVVSDALLWQPVASHEALTIDVAAYFRSVLDD